MELLFLGIPVPPLGSPQDRILRTFLRRRAQKEVYKNKLLAQYFTSAIANNAPVSKELNSIWNDYVAMEFFCEEDKNNSEADMKLEYSLWSSVRPILTKNKKGAVVVTGLPVEQL